MRRKHKTESRGVKKSTYVLLALMLAPVVVSIFLKNSSMRDERVVPAYSSGPAPSSVEAELTDFNEELFVSVLASDGHKNISVKTREKEESDSALSVEEQVSVWQRNESPKIVDRLWESYGPGYEFPDYEPDSGEHVVDTIVLDEFALQLLKDGDRLVLPGHMDLGFDIALNHELTPGVRTIVGYGDGARGERLIKLVVSDGETTGIITTDQGVFEVDVTGGHGYLYQYSEGDYQPIEWSSEFQNIWGKQKVLIETLEEQERDEKELLESLARATEPSGLFGFFGGN